VCYSNYSYLSRYRHYSSAKNFSTSLSTKLLNFSHVFSRARASIVVRSGFPSFRRKNFFASYSASSSVRFPCESGLFSPTPSLPLSAVALFFPPPSFPFISRIWRRIQFSVFYSRRSEASPCWRSRRSSASWSSAGVGIAIR